MQLNRITKEVWGQNPQPVDDFRNFAEKIAILGSGGFRGGMGGDASPPTSLKVTILAEKSASILNNSAPFRDASPPPA